MNPAGACPPLQSNEEFSFDYEYETDQETGELTLWGVSMELRMALRNSQVLRLCRVVAVEDIYDSHIDVLRSTVWEMVTDIREAAREHGG